MNQKRGGAGTLWLKPVISCHIRDSTISTSQGMTQSYYIMR